MFFGHRGDSLIFVIVIISIFILAFIIMASITSSSEREKKRKKEADYHELNYRQFNRGMDTTNLKTAKDALYKLEIGYKEISSHVDSLSASCYREDIRDVRSNIDAIVEEKWARKAEKILDNFLSTYYLITNPEFSNIEQAHRSKSKCLHQYDAYWEWTRKMHEENRDSLGCLNLWNEAKEMFQDAFSDYASEEDKYILQHDSYTSMRQRIEKRLSDCINAMQPEYKRKMELRGKILQRVNKATTIQRSNLLGGAYTGFVKAEINACYKGLLNEGCIIEVKQGNLYFVSLTEKGEHACQKVAKSAGVKKECASKTAELPVLQPEKAQKTPVIEEPKANEEQFLTEVQLIQHLDKHKIKWVDKRNAGGCLWIVSTPETDAILADLKIDGKGFRKAKTRHFVSSEGWFLTT